MPNEFIIKNGFSSQGNSNITGSLTVSGSISTSVIITGSDYTITTLNSTVELTGNNTTASLYSAASNIGRQVYIKNGSTGTVFITGSNTIDGRPHRRIGVDESCLLQSDGTNWILLNNPQYTIQFSHDSLAGNYAANTTYYFGNYFSEPSTASTPSRQVRAMASGWATAVGLTIRCVGTTSGESSTLVLRNLSTSTSTTISSTIKYDLTTDENQILYFTLTDPLQITKGDILEMRLTTGAWITGPTGIRHIAQVLVQ
jgi:hypothetical protein